MKSEEFAVNTIREICDGDLRVTDKRAEYLSRNLTVENVRYRAMALSSSGFEW